MKRNYQYVYDFEKLGYGMFVHFGLYSIIGKGEWYRKLGKDVDISAYENLMHQLDVHKNWAKDLVKTAKESGCKYITITSRHHDGFSLYDTCGLSEFDAPHSKSKRDLIKEFVEECHKENIKPFFYHTLLDWHNKDYEENFNRYLQYLYSSVELLVKNYGEIGGLWFDGMWDKPDANWKIGKLYKMIRSYQPNAMIINNTGLSETGKIGHKEIDSVTFERGNPRYVDKSARPVAGEMCQVLNDHWGYAENDINYKPLSTILSDLVNSRYYNCNFLLNSGPLPNGQIRSYDKAMLQAIGKWNNVYQGFIYNVKGTNIACKNGQIFIDEKGQYYIAVHNVSMSSNPDVTLQGHKIKVSIPDKKIQTVTWLDNNEPESTNAHSFYVTPFPYGYNYCVRIGRIEFSE